MLCTVVSSIVIAYSGSASIPTYLSPAVLTSFYLPGLMRSHGLRMYAADGEASLSYFDADWTFPSALVVGGEARGLGDDARRGLERGEVVGVSVPLEGGVESLNAAVAGAIVLGEAQRQRAMGERGLTLGGETEAATEVPVTRDGLSTNAQ